MYNLKSKIEELKSKVDKKVCEKDGHGNMDTFIELAAELDSLIDEYIGATASEYSNNCECSGKDKDKSLYGTRNR